MNTTPTTTRTEGESFAHLSNGFYMGRYWADRVAAMHKREFGIPLEVTTIPGASPYYRIRRPNS